MYWIRKYSIFIRRANVGLWPAADKEVRKSGRGCSQRAWLTGKEARPTGRVGGASDKGARPTGRVGGASDKGAGLPEEWAGLQCKGT